MIQPPKNHPQNKQNLPLDRFPSRLRVLTLHVVDPLWTFALNPPTIENGIFSILESAGINLEFIPTMVLLNYPSDRVRLFIRILFYACSFAIIFFGGQSNSKAAQLAFIRTKRVPVLRTSGWYENFGLLNAIGSFRAIPGGPWAFTCMVLSSILGIVGDLAVTTFVVSANVPDRCEFSQGLVFQQNVGQPFTGTPVNGAPFAYLQQVQLTSLNNGGLAGIYKKANNDTMFRADQQDILGGWNCVVGDDMIYPANTTLKAIKHDLVQNENLYDTALSLEYFQNRTIWSHFVLFSASTIGIGEAWDLKAAVQVNYTITSQPIDMRLFSCAMNATLAEEPAYSMNTTDTLRQWVSTFQGLMYDGSRTNINIDASARIERLLNTMVMIQGGNDYLLATPPQNDSKQGCLKPHAKVPIGILCLTSLQVAFALFLMAKYWVDVFKLRSFDDKTRQRVAKLLPYYQADWLLHAIRERAQDANSGIDASIIEKDKIKQWDLVDEGDTKFPRLKSSEPQAPRLAGDSYGLQETSPFLSVPAYQPSFASSRTSMISGIDQSYPNQYEGHEYVSVLDPARGQYQQHK